MRKQENQADFPDCERYLANSFSAVFPEQTALRLIHYAPATRPNIYTGQIPGAARRPCFPLKKSSFLRFGRIPNSS